MIRTFRSGAVLSLDIEYCLFSDRVVPNAPASVGGEHIHVPAFGEAGRIVQGANARLQDQPSAVAPVALRVQGR